MRGNHKDNVQKALRLMGLHSGQPLSFRQRMGRDALVEAMDYGATFSSSEDALRFVRRKRVEVMMIILMILMLVGFLMATTSKGGYTDGFNAGMKVCQLIIARG